MTVKLFLLSLCLISLAILSNSLQIPKPISRVHRSTNSQLLMQSGSGNKNIFEGWNNKFIPAILGSALLIFNPMDANALPSGSRAGGSSFRTSTSRSYSSSPRSSYSGPRSGGYSSYSPTIISPVISPFYSPFGFGFGGFMPINLNVIILAGVAYAAYSILSNRIGGSDFSTNDEYGSLGSGASVLKLSVALESDWSKRNNMMNTLSEIAARNGAMTGRNDIARLLSETSVALLRQQSEWTASSYQREVFGENNVRQAEPLFQTLAVRERTKFEEETKPTVATIRDSNTISGSVPTQVVVSLVVALRGQSSANLKTVRSLTDLKTVLEGLAADAMTDEGENVMAVEVLWTPSEPGATLSSRDLIVDYPELIRL